MSRKRLRQLMEGHNVVEGHGHVCLTLRERPVAFLTTELTKRSIDTWEAAIANAMGDELLLSASYRSARRRDQRELSGS